MKLLLFTIGAILAPGLLFAQISSPDTLKIDVKKDQQLILIGKDLKSFEKMNVDSVIRKSLALVKDSLADESKGTSTDTKSKDGFKTYMNHSEFGVQLGAGLLQNKPNTVLTFNMNVPFSKLSAKSKRNHFSYLGVEYTNNFVFKEDAGGDNRLYTAGFAGLAFRQYKYKMEDGKESRNFLGDVGIGYQINGRYPFLQNKTFVLFSTGRVLKDASLRGNLFIEGKFKRVYPGFTFYF